MQQVSDQEFNREARLLLTRLSRTNGFLLSTSEPGKSKPYQIFSGRNDYRKPVGRTPSWLVLRCIEAQWLAGSEEGRLKLTGAARRWLKNPGDADPARETPGAQKPVISDDPLTWLATRKTKSGKAFLTPTQLQAAENFRRDFEAGQFMPSITSNWSPVYADRKERRGNMMKQRLPDAPRILAAKQRFSKACQVLGDDLTSIVLEVCCLMRGLEAAESRLDWPKRSAKIVLKIALGLLAEHYGLQRKTEGNQRIARIRSLGVEGYRP